LIWRDEEEPMMTCIERLRSFFDEHGVKHEVQEHRDVFTMQEVAAELHEKGAHVAKVVIRMATTDYVRLAAPAVGDFVLHTEPAGAAA
jgi:hypothetical protein